MAQPSYMITTNYLNQMELYRMRRREACQWARMQTSPTARKMAIEKRDEANARAERALLHAISFANRAGEYRAN